MCMTPGVSASSSLLYIYRYIYICVYVDTWCPAYTCVYIRHVSASKVDKASASSSLNTYM